MLNARVLEARSSRGTGRCNCHSRWLVDEDYDEVEKYGLFLRISQMNFWWGFFFSQGNWLCKYLSSERFFISSVILIFSNKEWNSWGFKSFFLKNPLFFVVVKIVFFTKTGQYCNNSVNKQNNFISNGPKKMMMMVMMINVYCMASASHLRRKRAINEWIYSKAWLTLSQIDGY